MRAHLCCSIKDLPTARKRIHRLVKDGILWNLDFTYFRIALTTLKESKSYPIRTLPQGVFGLLELIHTYIYGKLHIPCISG